MNTDMQTSGVVVSLKRRYEGIRDAEAAMTVIRNAMYGHDAELLAKRIGRSLSCVHAIRSGRTKWPHHYTFFALLVVLDLEMIIRPRQ